MFKPHRAPSTVLLTTKQASRINSENLRSSSWQCSWTGRPCGDSPGALVPGQHLTLSVGPQEAQTEQGCRVKRPPQWTEGCLFPDSLENPGDPRPGAQKPCVCLQRSRTLSPPAPTIFLTCAGPGEVSPSPACPRLYIPPEAPPDASTCLLQRNDCLASSLPRPPL